ncbi:MAG: PKD domain-containing protein [Bacteroidales bacterium]
MPRYLLFTGSDRNNKAFRFLFSLSFMIISTLTSYSQIDYFWVGGSGQWEDYAHHWATTSGGNTFHTAKPTLTCNVIFDDLSFTAQNQIVIVGDPNIFCHDMIWSNIPNGTTFVCGANINIGGSLTFASNMVLLNNSGVTSFDSDDFEVINTGGSQNPLKNITINGNGTWTLQNYLNVDNDITLDKGTLITDDHTLQCSKFISTPAINTNLRILDLGSSLFLINSANNLPYLSWNVDNSTGTFHVISNGNSLIQFQNTSGLSTMHAGVGLNYDDVKFMGPGRLEIDFDTIRDATFIGPGEIIGDTNIVHDALFLDYGMINGHDNIFNDVVMQMDGDIGNLSLSGRNVDHNHFNLVDIWHRGRVYGNGNVFNDLFFSSHPEDCCPFCLSCVYCGYYQDGELHGNNDTVYNQLIFTREGKIFGTHNYFNNTTFWCDGWVLEGSNEFVDLNLYRHYQECFGSITQYSVPVSVHKNVLTLQQDSTQHVFDDFTLLGDFFCEHTLIKSTSTSLPAHFNSDSVMVLDYIELKNIHSANQFNIPDTAIRSLDSGGNDFWVFDLVYDSLQTGQTMSLPVTPCYGNCTGSIIFDPSGGIPPYLYSIMIWDPVLGYQYWTNFQTADTFSGLCAVPYPIRVVDYYGCLLSDNIPVGSPPQIFLLDTILTHISCFGANDGTITFIAAGGTGPLSFSLDNGPFLSDSVFTGLIPGEHSVTIQDSVGCMRTFGPFVIIEPADLSVNTGGADVIIRCHGDSTGLIIALPAGGTPPYLYTYIGPVNSSIYICDTVITNEDSILGHAGIWKVLITDANGCKDSTLTQRFEPPPIEIVITTGSSNNCADTLHFFAQAQASGGTPAYLYQWYTNTGIPMAFGPNLNNIPPGTYMVKVTDSYTCRDSAYTTIDILSDTMLSIHDKNCKNGFNDGDICVQGVGGSGQFAYLWSYNSQITPCIFYLDTGQYFVTITDQVYGCFITDSATIRQPDSLLSVFTYSDSTSCNGVNDGTAWVSASGGTPPYTYQWSNGLGTNDTVSGLQAGTYFVTVTDSLNCMVYGMVGIDSPPPGQVSFQTGWHCTAQGYWATAIATGGTAPYTYTWSPSFSTSNQVEGPPGIYIVDVVDINGCSFNGSIELFPFETGLQIHNVDCFNGNTGYASADAIHGNPPYNYQWYLVGNPVPLDNDNLMQDQPAGDYYLLITDSYGCQSTTYFTLTQPLLPLTVDVTSNSTLNFCYEDCNAFAVAQPFGGTPPYYYQWTPGNMTTNTVTGLCQGNYSVDITDENGCLFVGSTIISAPPQLIIDSVVVTPLLCNQPGYSGSAKVYALGGTGIIRYSIDGQPYVQSNVFNNLSQGIHYLSIRDDNFCVLDSTFSIPAPPILQVSISGQGPTAFGGSDGWLLASPIGGTPGYQYSWNNGVNNALNTGLPQGIYSVTITDNNGCQIVKDTLLSSPGELLLSVSYQDLECNGINTGSITASASGGIQPYIFQWSTGQVNTGVTSVTLNFLPPGFYSVTVTDFYGITRNQNVLISQPPPWQTTLIYPDSICPGTTEGYASLTVNGNTPPYSYSWNGGLGANTDSVYQLAAGDYAVTVTDSHNCTAITFLSIKNYYPPIAEFSLDTVCLGNSITLTDQSTVEHSTLLNGNIDWGDGNTETLSYPLPLVQHLYANPGTYDVSLFVEDINACISTVTHHNAVVFSIPEADYSFDTACFNSSTTFIDLSGDNGFPIVNQYWLIENDTVFNQGIVNHIFSQYGNHWVKLFVQNALNCYDSLVQLIPVDSLPYPSFDYHDSVCVPGMIRFIDLSQANGSPLFSYSYDFGDGYGSALTDPIHTYMLTGQAYPVTLTVTSERGCSNQTAMDIPVSPPFILSFQSDSSCFGEPTNFSAISLSPPSNTIIWQYWYFGDGNTALMNNPSYTYAAPGTYTVVLNAIDEHGCEETVFDSAVVVYPLPSSSFTYAVQCDQPVVNFTSTSQPGVQGPLTHVWNFGDGSNPLTTLNSVTQHVYPGPGTYTVTLQVINGELCENTISIPIIIESPAMPDFSADSACPGTAVHFFDLTQPPPIAWSWNFGDPASGPANQSTLQNPEHNFSLPGNYQVSLTITNQNNCSFSVNKTVSVVYPPLANFTYNTANACFNDTITFTDLSTTPSGTVQTWYWTFDDINSGFNNHSVNQHPGHLFTEAGYYNVSLVVTANSGNGCQDTTELLLTVNPHPLADFTFNIACHNDSTQFLDASAGISSLLVSYFWDFGDGNTSSEISPWHTYINPGTYQVIHIVWDDKGCSDTIVKPFVVAGPPLPGFTHSTLCLNNPVQFTDNSDPINGTIISWYWDFGDTGSGFNNYSTLQNPVHNFQTPGTYLIRHGVVNSIGCRDTLSFPISINATPLADFSTSDSCLGLPTQFTDLSTTSSGIVTSWYWDFGDGQYSSLQNPVHIYQSSGTHYATLDIIDAAQCYSTITLPVVVYPLPNPLFTAQISCAESPVFFTNFSNGGGFQVSSWSWNFGDPNTTLDVSTLQNPSYIYSDEGFYDVTLSMTNSEGCSNQVVQSIFIPAGAVADFSVDTLHSCLGLPVLFHDESYGLGSNIISWLWDFNDGTTSTQINPSHTFLSAGLHPVTLTVTTLNGCTKAITKDIFIHNLPSVNVNYTGQCFLSPTQFFGTAGSANLPIVSWEWDFGDPTSGLNNTSLLQDPEHIFSNPGTYIVRLTVRDSKNCPNTYITGLTIYSVPEANFTFTQQTCHSDTVCFSDASSYNGTIPLAWSWQFGDAASGALNTSGLQSPCHIYGATASYDVTLTITNTFGCQDDTSMNIVLLQGQSPTADFTFSTECFGTPTIFHQTSVAGGTPIINYFWNFNDPASGTNNSTTFPDPQHHFSAAGTYNVTLTVVSQDLCSHSKTSQVTVKPTPFPGFSYSGDCQNSLIVFQDTSLDNGNLITSWSWIIDGFNSGTSSNISSVFPTAGNHTITLNVMNQAGCDSSAQLNLTVFPSPVADYTMNPPSSCISETVSFSAVISQPGFGQLTSYQWDFGDGTPVFLSTTPFSTHQYLTAGNFNISLIVMNSHGCVDTIVKELTVRALPTPTINITSPSCVMDTVTFTSTSTLPNGGSIQSYSWNFGDPASGLNNFSSLQNPMHLFTPVPGNYTVTLQVNDGFCSNQVQQSVNLYSLPLVNFSFDTACLGEQTHFHDLSTSSGTTINSWQWNLNPGNSVQQHPVKTYLTAGYHAVTLTVTDGNSCQAQFTRLVPVDSLPIPHFSYHDTCSPNVNAGQVILLDQSIPNGSPVVSWLWQLTPGNTSAQQNPVYIFNQPNQTYPVTLTVTSARGCSNSITQNVHVAPALNINFTALSSCFEDSTYFIPFVIEPGGVVPEDWTWKFGDASPVLISSADTASHYFNSPGNYYVVLQLSLANGCADSLGKFITVDPLPLAAFTYDTSFCDEITHFYDLSSSAGNNIISWTWDFGDPLSGPANLSVLQNPSHQYPEQGGNFLVTLTVMTSDSCQNSISLPVIHGPCIQAEFLVVDTLTCTNLPVIFHDSSYIGGTATIISRKWNFGDGSPLYIYTAYQDPVIHTYTQSGNYTISLVILVESNNIQYSDTAIHLLTIYPTPEANFLSDSCCLGDSIYLENQTFIQSGSISTWLWTFGDNSTSSVENPPPHFYLYAGTYPVSLTVISDHNCTSARQKTVKVWPVPQAGFSAMPLEFCGIPDSVFFTDYSSISGGTISQYIYHLGYGQGIYSGPGDQVFIYNQYGTFTVGLTVISDKGCVDSLYFPDLIQVRQKPEPYFTWTPKPVTIMDPAVHFTDQTISSGSHSCNWDFGDGTGWLSGDCYPVHIFQDTGTYKITLYVTDQNTCDSVYYDTLTIRGDMTVYIPNAFSPDGDHLNDEFGPIGTYLDPDDYLMMIYNRWGEEIFRTTDLSKPWDGRVKETNDVAPVDVYVYFLRVKEMYGSRKEFKGTVLLLKKE